MADHDDVDEEFEAWLADLVGWAEPHLPDAPRFDSHVHLGIDAGSGHEVTLDQLERHMRVASIDRALLIPLNASDGYRRANERLAELARGDDRFESLGRIDPNGADPAGDAAAALDAGAVGLKLHPLSDHFRVDDERLDGALELVDERGALVLVHTGIDVDRAALDTLDRAAAHPGATFVLGHLPVEGLWESVERIRELPNAYICTAWWGPYDLALALEWLRPDRLLLGSDPPYGAIPVGLVLTGLVARASALDDPAVAGILGGTFSALLDGTHTPTQAPPVDREVSPERDPLARVPVAFRRCYQYLIGAGANVARGGDDASYARLASNCLEPSAVPEEHHELAGRIQRSIDLASRLAAEERTAAAYGTYAAALTQSLAGPRL